MIGFCRRTAAWLLAALLLTLPPFLLAAQEPPVDVRVVIDISGSMKKNDPHTLRIPAANLLIDLLPANSRAGIWLFGEQVNLLVRHAQVDSAWRELARRQVGKIDSSGLFTHIGAALEQAGYDLKQPTAKGRVHLIFLTDGLVDVSKDPARNQAERQRIIEKILPRYQQAGVTIHTIALSAEADHALLKQMARTTGGISATANHADELLKLFLQALEQAAPATELPLADNRFSVDSAIEEFTLLALHPAQADAQVRLLAPDGTAYEAQQYPVTVSWHRDRGYDLVTVRKPAAGEWVLQSDPDPGNRVRVVSNLQLKVDGIPGSLAEAAPINGRFWLEEAGKPLTDADLLRLLTITAQLSQNERLLNSGQLASAGQPPADGIYGVSVTGVDLPGSYEFLLKIDGKSFVRQYRQRIQFAPPGLDHVTEVQLPADAFGVRFEQSKDAKGGYRLEVTARHPEIDLGTVEAKVMVHPPHNQGKVRDLPKQGTGRWQLELLPAELPEAGQYRLALQLRGKTRQGAPFNLYPDEIVFIEAASSAGEADAEKEVAEADDASAEEAHSNRVQMGVAAGVFFLAVGGVGYFFWRRYRKSVADAQQEVSDAVKQREERRKAQATREASSARCAESAVEVEADAEMGAAEEVAESGKEQVDADELDRLVDEILADEERPST